VGVGVGVGSLVGVGVGVRVGFSTGVGAGLSVGLGVALSAGAGTSNIGVGVDGARAQAASSTAMMRNRIVCFLTSDPLKWVLSSAHNCTIIG